MTDSTGKAQGLGIDNLSFSASVLPVPIPLDIQISGANLLLNWPTTSGLSYQVEYKDDLTGPTWIPLGSPIPGTGGSISVTNDFTLSTHRFFRISVQ